MTTLLALGTRNGVLIQVRLGDTSVVVVARKLAIVRGGADNLKHRHAVRFAYDRPEKLEINVHRCTGEREKGEERRGGFTSWVLSNSSVHWVTMSFGWSTPKSSASGIIESGASSAGWPAGYIDWSFL
jgi:hypothetical protein